MLEEIKLEARELVAKQSWVRKGLSELIAKMDAEVADIDGSFLVRGSLYEHTHEYRTDVRYGYFLVFDGRDDAEFYIEKGSDRCEGWEYKVFPLDEGEISTLRKCIIGIPGALEEILGKLKELNAKYKEAADRLTEMLARLA